MSEIYLLSTTPQMVPKYNVGLASKFEDERCSASAGGQGLEVHDGQTGFANTWNPTRLQDLVKNSGLAAKSGFEALVGLGKSKVVNSEREQGWKDKE
ncbi:hypothetical protein BT69DRAFT_1349076 [Atractiella rhizophila]|nr:hypothetical protein BT69DRAFT_1349076 [Atractiella rhizophila]